MCGVCLSRRFSGEKRLPGGGTSHYASCTFALLRFLLRFSAAAELSPCNQGRLGIRELRLQLGQAKNVFLKDPNRQAILFLK